ncbi:MAG: tetratricopeptide repeat protein [Proteobacteria bacterium]|nr:tetratricopeptide repeat protein [Pseudomonadota bacterium]
MTRSLVGNGIVNRVVPIIFLVLSLFMASGCASRQSGLEEEGSYLHVRAEEARAVGVEAYTKGNYSSALQSFDSALKIDRAVDDRAKEVVDLINIARVSIAIGDMEAAEAYLDDAVNVSLEANLIESLGSAYATLAKVEYLTGRHDSALAHIEESIEADRGHGIQSGAALNLMGAILAEGGRFTEAKSVLARALKLNKVNKDGLELANSYRSLGLLHNLMKSHDKAIEQYRHAYDLDTRAGNSAKIAVDLSSMAALHHKLGRLNKAAYLLERSYIVNLNGGRTIDALGNLTFLIETYSKLGKTDKVHYFARIKSSLLKSYENGMEGQ